MSGGAGTGQACSVLFNFVPNLLVDQLGPGYFALPGFVCLCGFSLEPSQEFELWRKAGEGSFIETEGNLL